MEDEIRHHLKIGAADTMNIDTPKDAFIKGILEFSGVRLLLVLNIAHDFI